MFETKEYATSDSGFKGKTYLKKNQFIVGFLLFLKLFSEKNSTDYLHSYSLVIRPRSDFSIGTSTIYEVYYISVRV